MLLLISGHFISFLSIRSRICVYVYSFFVHRVIRSSSEVIWIRIVNYKLVFLFSVSMRHCFSKVKYLLIFLLLLLLRLLSECRCIGWICMDLNKVWVWLMIGHQQQINGKSNDSNNTQTHISMYVDYENFLCITEIHMVTVQRVNLSVVFFLQINTFAWDSEMRAK